MTRKFVVIVVALALIIGVFLDFFTIVIEGIVNLQFGFSLFDLFKAGVTGEIEVLETKLDASAFMGEFGFLQGVLYLMPLVAGLIALIYTIKDNVKFVKIAVNSVLTMSLVTPFYMLFNGRSSDIGFLGKSPFIDVKTSIGFGFILLLTAPVVGIIAVNKS
ncbi:hypothetical protein [Haloplasma contractile]|uniref:Uncharacterized protein n=1 Tax=Haloplasma contractile SSD-17B TaxID=1033810 RepID=F7PUU6_9MOLU|nr:hypothetical protein [Haloplasma contractile]ERJ11036.1 hypothetical protein HLPCO_002927 [Haloplasma contractile SSD-17B]